MSCHSPESPEHRLWTMSAPNPNFATLTENTKISLLALIEKENET